MRHRQRRLHWQLGHRHLKRARLVLRHLGKVYVFETKDVGLTSRLLLHLRLDVGRNNGHRRHSIGLRLSWVAHYLLGHNELLGHRSKDLAKHSWRRSVCLYHIMMLCLLRLLLHELHGGRANPCRKRLALSLCAFLKMLVEGKRIFFVRSWRTRNLQERGRHLSSSCLNFYCGFFCFRTGIEIAFFLCHFYWGQIINNYSDSSVRQGEWLCIFRYSYKNVF